MLSRTEKTCSFLRIALPVFSFHFFSSLFFFFNREEHGCAQGTSHPIVSLITVVCGFHDQC